MKAVWMKLNKYLETAYDEASRPDPRTVRAQIDRGEIIGERRGSGPRAPYFVLVDAETGLEAKQFQIRGVLKDAGVQPVNDVAAQILQRAMG